MLFFTIAQIYPMTLPTPYIQIIEVHLTSVFALFGQNEDEYSNLMLFQNL
jgi:hypothetical protein